MTSETFVVMQVNIKKQLHCLSWDFNRSPYVLGRIFYLYGLLYLIW